MGYQKLKIRSIIWKHNKNIRMIHYFWCRIKFWAYLPCIYSIIIFQFILIDGLGAPYMDSHQFFCVPHSPHQNFDSVNETIHFLVFTVVDIKLQCCWLSRACLKIVNFLPGWKKIDFFGHPYGYTLASTTTKMKKCYFSVN